MSSLLKEKKPRWMARVSIDHLSRSETTVVMPLK